MLFYGTTGVLAVLYAVLLFFQPDQPTSQIFVLSKTARAFLQITFAAPIILIWFLGTGAVLESSMHAEKTRVHVQKVLFHALAWGIGILLLGFIFGVFVGQIKSYYPSSAYFYRMATIIVNYTYVFPPLFGFLVIFRAAGSVQKEYAFNDSQSDTENSIVASTMTTLIGVFWIALIFTNTGRQVSQTDNLPPSFYISDFTIFSTIVAPTLLAWFYGIAAAFHLADFSMERGDGQRTRALSQMVSGIWLLIFSYILLFGLLSAGASRLVGLGLGGVVAALYIFIFALLVGHWRIAAAVKKISTEEISYESRE